MPMTDLAYAAFKEQAQEAVGSEYLFPRLTDRGRRPYLCSVKKTWRTTLRRAGVPYSSLYELRHTFQRRRSGRPFCYVDASARRCGRLQKVQPGQTQHDAGSPRQTGPSGQ